MKAIFGGNPKVNRSVVENKSVDVLINPEKNNENDYMHYRNSGLNQVLCKLAKKNNVAIGFNFNSVLNTEGINRSKILGRMIQNVKLCKKYKVKMIIINLTENPYELKTVSDLKSFGICLGMHPSEISVRFL
ncbi:hypothetical protein K8R47_01460 [archaeon]|nr:hypothetical protein [archaeon]